jgi:uncharacterized protein YndB with AHSA1/START domain
VRAGAEEIFDLWTSPDLMVRWMSPPSRRGLLQGEL